MPQQMENKNLKEGPGDLEDKGSVLGKYKKNFILLFLMVLLFVVVFILQTAGILTTLIVDLILAPFVILATAMWLRRPKE